MPREVNAHLSGWRATGVNVAVPQYEIRIRFEWVRRDGTAGSDVRTVRFPNVLANIPAARLRDYLEAILMNEARIAAGVDAE